MAMRIVVPANSELDATLAAAEARGETVELVRNGRTYRLVPTETSLSPEELARRHEIVSRARAIRDKQKPLGITTAQLIHEVRAERYGE